MKFLKFSFITLIIVGVLGYGVYYFGTNMASGKVVDAVYIELEDSGQLEEVKQMVNDDPEIKKFIKEGASVDESKLPFKTKEQATRVLIQRIGLSKIQAIKSKFENGMSKNEIDNLLKEMDGKLTKEEVLALKVIAYKELNK